MRRRAKQTKKKQTEPRDAPGIVSVLTHQHKKNEEQQNEERDKRQEEREGSDKEEA